jgi:hypothetical protein
VELRLLWWMGRLRADFGPKGRVALSCVQSCDSATKALVITITSLIVPKSAEKCPFVMHRTRPGSFEVLVGIEADG